MNSVVLTVVTQLPAFFFSIISAMVVRKKMNRFFTIIAYTLLLNFAILILGILVQFPKGRSNHWLFNLYIIFETVLLLKAATLAFRAKWARTATATVFMVFITVWLTEIFRYQIFSFAQNAYVLECVGVAVLYLILLLTTTSNTEIPIYRNPVFWVCCAHIISFSCAVPYFGLFDFLKSQKGANKILFQGLIVSLQSIRYILIGIAFILIRKTNWNNDLS